jgi:AcrR family transcriptional regulator
MTESKVTAKGEQTRAAIIKAAYRLFLKKGFHGTSIREIAEQAEIALGGIYNHFGTKEDIFDAVLDAYHPYHAMLPALESVEGETVEAFVRDAAGRIRVAIDGAESRLMPLVFIELVEFQGRHLAKIASKLLPSLFAFAQRLGGRRGKLRPMPLPVMLRAFMGVFIGFLLTEMVLKNVPAMKDSGHDWFGGMVEIYLHGILQPES